MMMVRTGNYRTERYSFRDIAEGSDSGGGFVLSAVHEGIEIGGLTGDRWHQRLIHPLSAAPVFFLHRWADPGASSIEGQDSLITSAGDPAH